MIRKRLKIYGIIILGILLFYGMVDALEKILGKYLAPKIRDSIIVFFLIYTLLPLLKKYGHWKIESDSDKITKRENSPTNILKQRLFIYFLIIIGVLGLWFFQLLVENFLHYLGIGKYEDRYQTFQVWFAILYLVTLGAIGVIFYPTISKRK